MSWDHNKLWDWHPAVPTGADRTRGQAAADSMKRALANWYALSTTAVVILGWVIVNSHLVLGKSSFDPFPWILLNLCLSTFAGVQCFVLLIANKRGEQIAANQAKLTLENTELLKQLITVNNDLTKIIHDHVLGEK